jgi:hypothetical protein
VARAVRPREAIQEQLQASSEFTAEHLRTLTCRNGGSHHRGMSVLKTYLLVVLTMLALPGCWTQARRQERERIDQCVLTLPILRSEPKAPYRVIYMTEASSETELAWYACAQHADAMISTFSNELETSASIGGGSQIVVGKSSTANVPKFIGRAIKYDRVE